MESTMQEIIDLCKKENSDNLFLNSLQLSAIPRTLIEVKHIMYLSLAFNKITEIPEDFCERLRNLTFLSMQGNCLRSLPDNFGTLHHLKELELTENDISYLPESFSELESLEKLNLVSNQLQDLPDNFGNLRNLKELILDENLLELLPKSFCELSQLERLDASENELKELPFNFGKLSSLKLLDLNTNHLICLPGSFGELPQLEILDLSHNELSVLPSECQSVDSLQKIYLDNNELSFLPNWFSKLTALEEFSVHSNSLKGSVFSAEFGYNCAKLRNLDLSGNYVENLPETFGHLASLEFLDMGSIFPEVERRRNLFNGNFLKDLPDSFGSLRCLKELRLDENEIHALPEEFGKLRCLEILDLSHNCLDKLPDSFCELSKLTICLLSINHLISLPLEIGKLKKVTDLRLDNNQINSLPESFDELTQLETLDLYCNNLRELPSCLQYFEHLKRLDLSENPFGVPITEVPDINFHAKYVERDPSKKENWRGRKRADVLDQQVIKLLYENSTQESQVKRIQDALSQGNSIWQSHTNGYSGQINGEVEQNNNDVGRVSSPSIKDNGLADGPATKHSEPAIVNHDMNCSEEEFWDLEPLDPYGYFEWDKECSAEIVRTVDRMKQVNVGRKPEEIFTPSDLHPKSYRSKRTYKSQENVGQFDDAD